MAFDRNTVKDLIINLIASALYVGIAVLVSWILRLSEQLSTILVASLVIVLGLSVLFSLTPSFWNNISRPVATIGFLFLIVSVLLNIVLGFRFFDTSKEVTVESLHPLIFSYGGDFDDEDSTGGSSSFTVNHLAAENVEYQLRYILPDNLNDVWAGLSFKFPEKQDFSQYESLKLTIIFGDSQTGGDSRGNCDLVFWDQSNHRAIINLREAEGTGTQNERTITVNLGTDIQGIDLNAIREISFDTNGYSPRGSHTYTISNIKLIRS